MEEMWTWINGIAPFWWFLFSFVASILVMLLQVVVNEPIRNWLSRRSKKHAIKRIRKIYIEIEYAKDLSSNQTHLILYVSWELASIILGHMCAFSIYVVISIKDFGAADFVLTIIMMISIATATRRTFLFYFTLGHVWDSRAYTLEMETQISSIENSIDPVDLEG
jgi:hypothetical protein